MLSTEPDGTATDVPALLARIGAGGVEFVVIGGVAAVIHGSAHVTYHLDILYRRTADNVERLAAALAPLHPYLRVHPPGFRSGSMPPRSRAGSTSR